MSRSARAWRKRRTGAIAGLLFVLSWDAAAATPAIWLISEPWPAPFSLDDLVEALQLRLRGFVLRVVAHAPEGASGPIVELVDGDPARIRLARRDRVLLDAPLPELRDGGARRAALLTVIALETAAPQENAPATVAAAQPAPVASPIRWAISATVGAALAIDDSSAGIAPALQVRARWFLLDAVSLDLGVKLSGAYEASSPGQTISIVDRSFWVGVAAHLRWGGALAAALGIAGQYTHPSVDADGVEGAAASTTSRFGVRASADLAWSVHANFALVAGVAVTFNLAEREFTAGGREVVELGSAGLDFTVGPEVRW